MNKTELIEQLRIRENLTKPEARRIVDLFFAEMARALARGDRVEIRGLFSFFIKKYRAYQGRNPRTGGAVKVKSKRLPFFKCSQALQKRINEIHS